MLQGKRQNIHRSKLPDAGQVGYITGGCNRFGEVLYWKGEKTRFIVESFPLCDNVWPWSRGIHTVLVRRLRDGARFRFSGFYFDPIENS